MLLSSGEHAQDCEWVFLSEESSGRLQLQLVFLRLYLLKYILAAINTMAIKTDIKIITNFIIIYSFFSTSSFHNIQDRPSH